MGPTSLLLLVCGCTGFVLLSGGFAAFLHWVGKDSGKLTTPLLKDK